MHPKSLFKKQVFFTIILVPIVSIFILSCRNKDREKSLALKDSFKPDTVSYLIKYENTLFPLPSPYQVMFLIKQHNIPFDESLSNKTENYGKYTTNFKKALNLGVYGTSLSYFNIYDRTQNSIQYLSVIKKASQDLNISQAFSSDFFSALQRNIGERDSILYHLSRAYRKSHGYLKENDRPEIGALIITGGWIESIYILTRLSKTTGNREIINRIGQQKYPINNIIEILTPYYYKSEEFAKLTDLFIELSNEFDGVIYTYSYKEPKIDVENKITYINSQSRVVMSEFHLEAISKRIEAIRNFIIE